MSGLEEAEEAGTGEAARRLRSVVEDVEGALARLAAIGDPTLWDGTHWDRRCGTLGRRLLARAVADQSADSAG